MAKQNDRYERRQGHRLAVGVRGKTISFSWTKLDQNQGQSIKEWEDNGLLSQLCERMRQIGQEEATSALTQRMIKQYTKVGFPPDSEFKVPKHVAPEYWAVIHVKPKSKAVVAGYLDDDVFQIVFLDMDHKFWPSMDIQDKNKVKR